MVSYKEIGKRLQEIRKKFGFSQADIANKLDMSRPTVSKIENGKKKVTSLELSNFADLYNKPISYFIEEEDQKEPVNCLLRAESLTETEKEQLLEAGNIYRKYSQLENMVFGKVPLNLPQYKFSSTGPYGSNAVSEGEKIAENERNRLGLNGAPVKDIFDLLEGENVKILKVHFGRDSDLAGVFFFNEEKGPCIVVNIDQNPGRTNFSAAHEYGHLLRDQDLFPSHLTRLENKKMNDENTLHEIRANAFAAAFLMPEEGVNKFFEEAGMNKGDKVTPEDVIYSQKHFGVSYQAMLYRLQNLDWIGEKDRNKLSSYSPSALAKSLGIQGEEKKDYKALPDRYFHLAIKAYEKEEINLGKLGELLKPLKEFKRSEIIDLLQELDIEVRIGPEDEDEIFEEFKNA